ncbi:MAG: iron ABC transporter ATP-binding protein [Gemmatimonadota bacterium]|nr:MAG: iron ABC transporter ATP-binding protein [Gemmatimonadota bacterium]
MRFETTDLVIKYPGQNRPALNGVNMSAPSGNFYAVLGPNGSGKSTLMKGLLGIAKADQGRVLIAERNVSNWDRKALARVVGVVSQSETVSFPITVREMVGMGRYPHLGPLEGEGSEDKVAVHEALEVCDVTHLVNRDLSTLSGGELQRVRIARALAQEPMALILDEPTSSLDIKHAMEILELLKQSVASGLTVILTTHGLDLAARFSDRMLLLSEGQVAAEGTPDEVVNEETLADVYGWPVKVEWEPTTGSPRVTPLRS